MNEQRDRPHKPNGSYGPNQQEDRLIPPHGGYKNLRSFQTAEIVYDATVAFCDRFVDKRSRTHDQMVQAARSGRQNIAEGSQASGISRKTELKLVSVARASLEELLLDYQDFLRQRRLPLWNKQHPRAMEIRKLAWLPNRSYATYRSYVEQSPPEVAANTLVCLVHQASYLLDRQLAQLERRFAEEGGFTERLYAFRTGHRNRKLRETPPDYGAFGADHPEADEQITPDAIAPTPEDAP
jgi:four helix bundle suffix protein